MDQKRHTIEDIRIGDRTLFGGNLLEAGRNGRISNMTRDALGRVETFEYCVIGCGHCAARGYHVRVRRGEMRRMLRRGEIHVFHPNNFNHTGSRS